MTVVIVACGFADDREPCPHAGLYLADFDFDAFGGLGFGEFTSDRAKAKRFKDAGEALKFWKTVSTVLPRRPDGEPNRPLTCLSVEIRNDDDHPEPA